MGTRRGRVTYYALLWAVCTGLFLAWCAMLFVKGHLLLWYLDSTSQYVNYFVYEGEAIREAFRSLVSGGGFVLPAYTYSVGYGADVFTTMAGILNDPLNLTSVLCPPRYAHYLFIALIWLRMCLAATTFSAFCFSKGHGRSAVLVGAMCYLTCGFVVLWGVFRHPDFLNVAILLPLMLTGADKVFEGEKPYLLIVSSAVMFFFSLYLSYIVCMVLVAYCVIRYFLTPRERGVRDFVVLVARFVGYMLIAGFMAAISWFPVLTVLTTMGRVGVEHYVPAVYNLEYYSSQALTLLGAYNRPLGAILGPVPVLCMSALLFCRRRIERDVRRPLAAALLICLVFSVVPFFGSALNGFSYASERWMVALGMSAAYCVVVLVPHLTRLVPREWAKVLAGCLVLVLLAAPMALRLKTPWKLLACVALLALLACVAACALAGRRGRPRSALLAKAFLVACTLVVALAGPAVMCAGSGGNYLEEMTPRGVAWYKLGVYNLARYSSGVPGAGVPGPAIEVGGEGLQVLEVDSDASGDVSPYRFGMTEAYGMRNASLLHATMFTSYYSSFYNQCVDDLRQELGLPEHYSNYNFVGEDGRMALEALVGARYFVSNADNAWLVPAGYEPVEDLGTFTTWGSEPQHYSFFETDLALPLGFAYTSAIDYEDYLALSMAGRQEALLQGCVLAGTDIDPAIDVVSPAVSSRQLDYELVLGDGVEQTDQGLLVTRSNATVTLRFEGLPDAETYVAITGLDFESLHPVDAKGVSPYGPEALLWTPASSTLLTFSTSRGSYEVKYANWRHVGYGGKHDFLVNLGYGGGEALGEVTISFRYMGVYSMGSLEVVCQPVDAVEAHIRDLQATAFTDVTLGTDEVTAGIDCTQDVEYAFFSLPYSVGWTATVDGEEAPVLRADTAFMAVEVQGVGHHDIRLEYSTPGSAAGRLLTVVGIVAFVALVVSDRVRSSREERR